MNAPEYLCIGHCCHDRVGDRYLPGGTATYSALAARHLGLNAGILTSVGPDFEFFPLLETAGIPVHNKPAEHTTAFENIYSQGQRTQYLHARACTLYAEDVPPAWASARIVQFSPIAGEVDFSLLRAFPNALRGATVQGWLRQWNAAGLVSSRDMDWSQLAAVDVVILSDADIAGFEAALPEIAAAVPVLVMTRGAAGAVVFEQGEQRHFPAYPVQEVDATGAGDVFAAAFLSRYAPTRDVAGATAFAHCAASFVVEGLGVENLAAVERIEERLAAYQWWHGI